jgi:hypothetical protein
VKLIEEGIRVSRSEDPRIRNTVRWTVLLENCFWRKGKGSRRWEKGGCFTNSTILICSTTALYQD